MPSPTLVIQRLAKVAVVLLFIVGGIVALFAFAANFSSASTFASRTSGIDATKARALIDQSVKAGYITDWTCTGNTAHVSPAFWLQINAQTKEGVVLALARVCDAEQSGDRMTIFDSRSGRQLAEYHGSSVTFD